MRWQKRRVQLKCLGRSRYWLLETGSPNALRSQTDETQATEVAIAVDLLNRMLGWDGRGTSAPHETRRAYPPRTELPLSPGCRVRFQPGPGQSCIGGNDPRVAATTGSDWTGPGAGWGAPRPANDAHSGRSRPQSQGGLQPPCSNAQPLDVARKRVSVAGRRRRASGRVRPCWDQAFPCYSPLTGWASGPVAASRPSGEHPPAGGPALRGSTVRWYPSPTWGHGHGACGECSPHAGAHDGALAASPRLCLRPKVWMEVRPYCTASNPAHRDWGRVHPKRFRPDWQVAPRPTRRAQARQSPQRRPRDASFSSVTSDDDHFGSWGRPAIVGLS